MAVFAENQIKMRMKIELLVGVAFCAFAALSADWAIAAPAIGTVAVIATPATVIASRRVNLLEC